MNEIQFPDNFKWGTATSAFQIEGSTQLDGRGESIWDRFADTPGTIEDGTNGQVACDHYHLWSEDIRLMKEIGLNAYRFSIAWPRILPSGNGQVNNAGLDFYDRLVDGLLDAGICPYVTLYHWDLPQVLQDRGGWPSRETAEHFVEYVDVVSRRLGGRVKHWITHNEPWCTSNLGYFIGNQAPGIKDFKKSLQASHHLLLSHGKSVPVLRQNCPGASVGICLNLVPATPASPSNVDREAYRHFDGMFNRWFLDPIYGRGYPKDIIDDYINDGRILETDLSFIKAGDLEIVGVKTDFLAINYYTREVIRSDVIPETQNEPRTVQKAPESEHTEMGWEVYPDGLKDILVRVHKDYKPPSIYITENGIALDTGPDSSGQIDDTGRIQFFKEHLRAAHSALNAGVPLRGYFHWSLMDNFEWAYGYTKRFGIIWVDYKNLARRLKASAFWYRDVITDGVVR